ncbi:hypothetical protein BD626DRAFT_477834 [Schizophyllum amplum]|uniref:Uncharacterized protein n=1 Tax=Schizophyllum amplum TaxID=97359 RepID=A0A550D0I9_9AGAR|nr:hypothetical protein BD626DRAFT_477834 [Auriculariopsis ampla]
MLPALRLLATHDVRIVPTWLRAAPGVWHLVVYLPVGRAGLEVCYTFGDLIVTEDVVVWSRPGTTAIIPKQHPVLNGAIIAEVDDVTIVAYADEGDERRAEAVGSYLREDYRQRNLIREHPEDRQGEVKIRRVWVPRPNVEAGESRPSLIYTR